MVHNKLIQAMSEREVSYLRLRKVQLDDAYLGGKRNVGKGGRGSENKAPIVVDLSIDEAGHPMHVKVTKVESFSFAAIPDWDAYVVDTG